MSLIGEERKKFILNKLNDEGEVKVKALAEELNVSTESIRQYLNKMESENKLKKVYGGAVKTSYNHLEPSLDTRENVNIEEKQRIGKAACSLIHDYDVIIIDEGSTTLQIIDHLTEFEGITVITNSVAALTTLIDYEIKSMFHGDIIFLGGSIDSKNYRATGRIAEEFIENFFVDHAFLATEGISKTHGLTSYSSDRAILSKKFMESAEKTTVLADHTKFNHRMYYKIMDLKGIDYIISDAPPPDDWNVYIYEQDINWIVATKDN